MKEAVGVGLDLDDVVQRACVSGSQRVAALPAVHVRLPVEMAARRSWTLALSASFAGPALALAHAGACGQVQLEVHDTFGLWRRLAGKKLCPAQTGPLRSAVDDLVATITVGRPARLTVAIPDPSPEEAQERWLAALGGAGRLQLVWRPVLAALGFVSRRDGPLPASFTVVAAEAGWGVLRGNVLKVERDPKKGLHVPERRRPGVEHTWEGPAPPAAERRISVGWMRRSDGCLVRATAAPAILPPDVAIEVEVAAQKLACELAERLTGDGTAAVVWLVEGALAGMPCGRTRLGDAVVRGLRRVLPDPADIVLADAAEGLVAHGGAECARRLALKLPAWWDALPQLEINRRNAAGVVEFVPLVDAPHIAGGEPYTHEVKEGFALPAGAERMRFVLLHEYHPTARRLEQPLNRPLPREIPVRLRVEQKPASGRARVEVVPNEPTPHFHPVELDWDRLADTGWDRETALRELRKLTPLRFPPKTPVPANLYHWRNTSLPQTLERFLDIDAQVRSLDYQKAVGECLEALRARPLPGGERVGAVSSDGEPHQDLRPDELDLLEEFRAKLDRDIRALPFGDATRQQLVLAGAWLYAAAPPAVREDIRLALKRREYPPRFVQAAGRSLSDELNVRLFFARCAERFDARSGNTDWTKALGQILIYREDACLWLDAERARLCLYGAVRELERAQDVHDQLRPQIFNNAILALLGLLRVRQRVPAFLLGVDGDPVPREVGRAIREHLDQLAGRLDRDDPSRAKRVREVLRYLEGEGTDQLVAAAFDE